MTDDDFIDTTLDLHFDAGGEDPDRYSPTMRRYHRILWSKPLPSGEMFELEDTFPKGYLLYRSEKQEIMVSSDTIIRTFRTHSRMTHILSQIPESERAEFSALGYTIGGMMVFPAYQIGGKQTINQVRGTNGQIEDRFDLTLECIRRHYAGREESPLAEVLERYSFFFDLFVDFKGYVDFFLLRDLVTDDYSTIRFLSPFDGFGKSGLLKTVEEYVAYRALTIDFVNGRNARIAALHS